MGIWDILGIDRTKDRAQIKKAYAKMLKLHHPEDDPEGFMKLRSAYEDALRKAEHIEHSMEVKRLEIQPVQEVKELSRNEANEEFMEFEYAPDESHADPLNELASIYNDVFKRRNIKCWHNFFMELSLIGSEDLCRRAYSFLNQNGDLPHEVWKLLDEQLLLGRNKAFKWQELIKYDFGLSFDYFDESADCDFTEYSRLRFSSFISLRQGNYKASAETAQRAFKIYDKDPVLLRICGIANYMAYEYDKAIETLSKAILINSSDSELLSYRGSAYFKKRDFERARSDFEAASKIEPDNFNHKKEILKCINAKRKFKLSESFLKKLFVKVPQDLELDMILTRIEQSKLRNRIKARFGFIYIIKESISSFGGLIFFIFLLLGGLLMFTPGGNILGVAIIIFVLRRFYKEIRKN
ncbi:MAG TPA: tetratricopeptide repeat protein [Clostridia bacterium]